MYKKNVQSGFIVMVSVLIVGSVALSIALTIVFVNINAGKNILLIQDSDQARMMANTCSEIALQELVMDNNISGGDTLTFAEGNCVYNISHGSGETRIIESIGQVKNNVRREKININSLTPEINIISWQEVANF